MKELIIVALNNAIVLLDKQIPQTKIEIKEVSIEEVKPLDLLNFMKENNIPDNAYFWNKPNSYSGFGDICLCYEVEIPTTDNDKLKFKIRRFRDLAWKFVYTSLINNGYKRVGFNSGLLKQFDDTTIYDMYINNDFDRLVKYYSLYFVEL